MRYEWGHEWTGCIIFQHFFLSLCIAIFVSFILYIPHRKKINNRRRKTQDTRPAKEARGRVLRDHYHHHHHHLTNNDDEGSDISRLWCFRLVGQTNNKKHCVSLSSRRKREDIITHLLIYIYIPTAMFVQFIDLQNTQHEPVTHLTCVYLLFSTRHHQFLPSGGSSQLLCVDRSRTFLCF